MVDIEPLRDINASSNKFKDHKDRPLMLQGAHLIQCKSILDNIRKANLTLVKYIDSKSGNFSTFIGDDSQITYLEMRKFAYDIAKHFRRAFSEIFVNEKLSHDEQQAFKGKLEELSENFSGKSILEQCIEGHAHMVQMLRVTRDNSASGLAL